MAKLSHSFRNTISIPLIFWCKCIFDACMNRFLRLFNMFLNIEENITIPCMCCSLLGQFILMTSFATSSCDTLKVNLSDGSPHPSLWNPIARRHSILHVIACVAPVFSLRTWCCDMSRFVVMQLDAGAAVVPWRGFGAKVLQRVMMKWTHRGLNPGPPAC